MRHRIENNADKWYIEPVRKERGYTEVRIYTKALFWYLANDQNFKIDVLDLEAIDEMTITIIPTLLGEGIPLFPNNPKETRFELINAESFETGAVNLNYKRRG